MTHDFFDPLGEVPNGAKLAEQLAEHLYIKDDPHWEMHTTVEGLHYKVTVELVLAAGPSAPPPGHGHRHSW